jgi:hypothetical protein
MYIASVTTKHDAACNIQLSTHKEYIETIIPPESKAAYNVQHSAHYEYTEYSTKDIAAEVKTQTNFTNFTSVKTHHTEYSVINY